MRTVAIIGSGPAAHTAAIYCARANLKTLLFEGNAPGGQLSTTTKVENYAGFPSILGPELCDRFREHSVKSGAEIASLTVTHVDLKNRLLWNENQDWECSYDALIIATGAFAKRLGIPGEDRFWQRGISACAVCDGALPCYRGKVLAVVGGGDTAMEEALYLAKFASQVLIIHRSHSFRASAVMQDKVFAEPKIKVLYKTVVKAALGKSSLEKILTSAGEIQVAGLFYAIGHDPASEFLQGQLELSNGYIVTKNGCTSVPGVFAAGNVQDPIYRQAIVAAGSGCIAALEAIRYLESY